LRLIVPGDAEWPTQLDDLGDARPLALWLRGAADLRLTCVNSVAVVGARGATGYGNHVAVEMAAVLAEHGIGLVSGGAKATESQPALTFDRLASPYRPCWRGGSAPMAWALSGRRRLAVLLVELVRPALVSLRAVSIPAPLGRRSHEATAPLASPDTHRRDRTCR
jgi:hypothetical protein